MKLQRARDVAGVLGRVLAQEVSRSTGFRGPSVTAGEEVDNQGARARAVRSALEELGPFYVKVGQMLSTRPDMMPEYMIQEFQNLHERVTEAPFTDFVPVLDEELGRGWGRYFREIRSDKALGTASLAQVYEILLHDGRRAVMKIQRPGIGTKVREDMSMSRQIARWLARRRPDLNDVVDFDAVLEGVFVAMLPELDFTIEAENMEDFRDEVEEFETLGIPDVVFATERVLVETLATGQSIRDVNRDDFSYEERERIGTDLLAFMYRGMFLDRKFHADPHPGNIFVSPGEKTYLLDWGMVGRVDRRVSTSLALVILNMAMNDGVGSAKAWIEMGRATSWANIPGFCNDLSMFVPTVMGKPMESLNFGVELTNILRYSGRRGIQTSPAIAVIGKAMANMEGSVRYLAPELSIVDVFRDEFQDIMFGLVREAFSEETAAHHLLEALMAGMAAPEQIRTLLRDASNRELTILSGGVNAKPSRADDRAAASARALRYTIAALGVAYLWSRRRRT